MGKVATTWAFAALSLTGVGLVFVYPPVAVGVAVVAVALSVMSTMSVNAALAQAAVWVASGGAATAVYLATASPWLAAVLLMTPLTLMYASVLATARRLLDLQYAIALLVALALFGLAWPTGWWGLAAAPPLLLLLFCNANLFATRRKEDAAVMRFAEKLAVGSTMPQLTLPERDGELEITLSELAGRPVLLLFVRGNWCPVCHVMMRIINREAETLAKHGVDFFIVSPTDHPIDQKLSAELGLQARVLLDRDSQYALSLGLQEGKHEGKDYPMAVAIFVDSQGVVRYVSQPDDVTAFGSENKLVEVLNAA
jgi:peroxiredoxin